MQLAHDQEERATQSDMEAGFIRVIPFTKLWELVKKSMKDWCHCVIYWWDTSDCRSGLAVEKESWTRLWRECEQTEN